MLDTYEFIDYPMNFGTYGIKTGKHIPGEVVHRYLTNITEDFGIYKRMQFNARVVPAAHREGEGWIVTTSQAQTSVDEKDRSERAQARALKLIAKTVVLSDGERLQSDTLICCTGWKHRPPVTFVPEAIAFSFGPLLLIDPATTSPLEAHADN
ncbi:hypothetical protein IFR04_001757 [Cadophora malorum]|uniref:Uncharacterized protein n=1 Tax=Cadophora malorum TaxID=108018 RepID=A0A8H7WHW8_9HELO|nr:hypothetical protein IFR04_001757 [Cadophora malorum]